MRVPGDSRPNDVEPERPRYQSRASAQTQYARTSAAAEKTLDRALEITHGLKPGTYFLQGESLAGVFILIRGHGFQVFLSIT